MVTRAQQQTNKVWRVGWLSPTSATNVTVPFFDAFRLKLNELGYVEGRNLASMRDGLMRIHPPTKPCQ